uniref:Uncharacterized protein n=1 Tax=Ascaris lumbricoides TaxID=6252 RepID=A0A0M3IEX1_ASCLU
MVSMVAFQAIDRGSIPLRRSEMPAEKRSYRSSVLPVLSLHSPSIGFITQTELEGCGGVESRDGRFGGVCGVMVSMVAFQAIDR